MTMERDRRRTPPTPPKDEVVFPIVVGYTPIMNKSLKLAQHILSKLAEEKQGSLEPIVQPVYADNGEHSHWCLIDKVTGDKLWSEDPEECKAMGHPVKLAKLELETLVQLERERKKSESLMEENEKLKKKLRLYAARLKPKGQ